MQYSSSILELDGLSSMVAKVFKRRRAKPLYLAKNEQQVLLKHLDDYILVGEERKVFQHILAKLKAKP